MEKKIPARVYYVSSPEDDTVLLAINVQIKDGVIRWFDTVKERVMEIAKVTEETPESFTFSRAGEMVSGTYTFTPLTLAIYNERVKKRLLSGQDFTNEKDMLQAIEKTWDNAW